MGDNLVPNGLSRGCRVFCSRSKYPKIIVHEAGEPNALVDFLDAEFLTGQHGGDVDPLAMQAEPAANGDDDVTIVERIGQAWQAIVTAC